MAKRFFAKSSSGDTGVCSDPAVYPSPKSTLGSALGLAWNESQHSTCRIARFCLDGDQWAIALAATSYGVEPDLVCGG